MMKGAREDGFGTVARQEAGPRSMGYITMLM